MIKINRGGLLTVIEKDEKRNKTTSVYRLISNIESLKSRKSKARQPCRFGKIISFSLYTVVNIARAVISRCP